MNILHKLETEIIRSSISKGEKLPARTSILNITVQEDHIQTLL